MKKLDINKDWYDNRKVRPKQFNATLERMNDGSYRVVRAEVLNVNNQYEELEQRVDARDFARDLNRSKVHAW